MAITYFMSGAMMDKVNAYSCVYEVHEQCNMNEFGRRHIPGYTSELGFGYFEFTKKETLKVHKNVMVMDKVKFS